MYQDSTSKQWFPATITRLCKEPRSYIITTKEGAQYRKTQAHMKPYQPQGKKSEDEHLSQTNYMWMVKFLNTKSHKIHNLAQSRPNGTLSSQLSWIYKEQCDYLVIRLDNTSFYHLHISGDPMEGRLLIL